MTKPRKNALGTTSYAALRKGFDMPDQIPAPADTDTAWQIHAAWAQKLEAEAIVAHMTNWERNQWNKAKRPGEGEPHTLHAFLELLRETRKDRKC